MKWHIIKKIVPSSHDIMRMQIKYIVTNGKESYKFPQLDVAVSFWSQVIADIPIDEIDLAIHDYEDKGNR